MSLIIPLRRISHGNAFRVTSLRLPAELNMPFIGVDHAWVSAPVFPSHHHAGLSVVSYVFPDSETGISNRNKIASRNLIHPCGFRWAAAGKGIVHEEAPTEQEKTVHSLQIFVGLSDPNMDPAAFRLNATDVTVVRADGPKIRVPVGYFDNVISPLCPPTDLTVTDITLEEGGYITLRSQRFHYASGG
ncbi:TPA: pirin family protein [Enterobacter cloacae]|nr:pirin family protein [Enterobacter cloacae]